MSGQAQSSVSSLPWKGSQWEEWNIGEWKMLPEQSRTQPLARQERDQELPPHLHPHAMQVRYQLSISLLRSSATTPSSGQTMKGHHRTTEW